MSKAMTSAYEICVNTFGVRAWVDDMWEYVMIPEEEVRLNKDIFLIKITVHWNYIKNTSSPIKTFRSNILSRKWGYIGKRCCGLTTKNKRCKKAIHYDRYCPLHAKLYNKYLSDFILMKKHYDCRLQFLENMKVIDENMKAIKERIEMLRLKELRKEKKQKKEKKEKKLIKLKIKNAIQK